MERSAWSAETLRACRALPRKMQIARRLETVFRRMALYIGPDELVIGSRTAGGYPEIDDAIDRGSAEPGYMIADYPAVLVGGLESVTERCERALRGLDESRPEQTDRVDTLQSMIVFCRAVIRLAGRYAEECLRLAETEADAARKTELVELTRICRTVPARPAGTLHEAIQSLWLAHLGVYLECDNCAFSLGRLDTGKQEGPLTGDPGSWRSFQDLWDAFTVQLRHMMKSTVIAANRGETVKCECMPRPFLSALTAGCIESGLDFTQGGALHNTSGIQAFGIGTCADWQGHEELRLRVKNTFPHYGNDNDEADSLAVRMIALLQEEVGRHTNARGGPFILGLWSFTSHVKHGKELAASADGRLRGQPLSHSMDPSVGCGSAGPTAIIRSAAKIDAARVANDGSLLIEIQPSLLRDAESMKAVSSLLRTYRSLGGIQLQLSAVTPEMLETAVNEPEKYAHLVVRVAGYSDYFVRLARYPELQAYVIAREKYASIGRQ